tara:strand:+ start:756 stop:1028 length:273 start_codon:yes stop_codon:yes gene_type:complete
MMSSILGLDGWDKEGKVLSMSYYASSKRWAEGKASAFHNEIADINEVMLDGRYEIRTSVSEQDKDNYRLKVTVKYYKDESKHEHKKNTRG